MPAGHHVQVQLAGDEDEAAGQEDEGETQHGVQRRHADTEDPDQDQDGSHEVTSDKAQSVRSGVTTPTCAACR